MIIKILLYYGTFHADGIEAKALVKGKGTRAACCATIKKTLPGNVPGAVESAFFVPSGIRAQGRVDTQV